MLLLDRDIVDCRALVVDGNPTSRSLLVSQLRDFGIGSVTQCGRLHDARKMLEARPFDVVLCEHHIADEDERYTAQNLLDDLRRAHLLPFSTVFIIVTAEATYAMVADAAESALDSYLLKPHTATALGERLTQARKRKKVLGELFTAIEQGELDRAARLCLERFARRETYWLYAARVGSELLLRQGRHQEARTLCEAVLATGALPWARLGIARAQIEAQQPTQALRTLETLVGDHPTHVDAYDVMGHVQLEQGTLPEALATCRKASALTPGSIARLQKHGMLAFYLGDRDEAARLLERAAVIGSGSRLFDHQSLLLLAFARLQQRDTRGVQRCQDRLLQALERSPQSRRLQRFAAIASVLNRLVQRELPLAAAETRALFGTLDEPGLDVEAACHLLALLSQMSADQLAPDEAAGWVDTLGLRFASSRGATELLVGAATSHPPHGERIRLAHQHIGEMAEQAVTHTVQGNHRAAVANLLVHAERTHNAKLIDMARMTLQRHGAHIDDAHTLAAQADGLRERYAAGIGNTLLGPSSGRQPGALTLREAPPASEGPDVNMSPVAA